ncbi:hypothetical protein PVK06_031066 [Gossypium arboreum]|uniref:Uncharacterized protein n=1 Tax=Gossypium arboreum TaxID=29729 RepID=A0ABR0NSJ8_GOSAR|nr:hypothetical protein PVK06_031066 [Gossypium arboreum]
MEKRGVSVSWEAAAAPPLALSNALRTASLPNQPSAAALSKTLSPSASLAVPPPCARISAPVTILEFCLTYSVENQRAVSFVSPPIKALIAL